MPKREHSGFRCSRLTSDQSVEHQKSVSDFAIGEKVP